MPRLAKVAVVALTASGCWMGRVPYDAPATVPSEADLAGTFRATAASLSDFHAEHLPSYATADAHELVLRADGTCSARTYFGTSTRGQPVDPSMPCRWSVISLPEVPLVDVEVVAGTDAVDQQYFIGADGKALVLYSYLTDPDAQRYAELSRASGVKPRRRTTGCS